MLNDLSKLYHNLILEHSRHPRNFGDLPVPPAIRRVGSNPLCGDSLMLFLLIENDIIGKISYTGAGCAIFLAASSVLSTVLEGKTCSQALALVQKFSKNVTLGEDFKTDKEQEEDDFKKLKFFTHVKNYPARIKCAMLFARTIESLLKNPKDCNEIVTSDS